MKKFSIGVLGAGTWGMALARMLTVSGNDVQVWSAIEAEVDNLSTTRVHPNLPGMVIPQELRFTKSIEEVCTGKDVLLFAGCRGGAGGVQQHLYARVHQH